MKIFQFEDYKEYVNDWINARPKKGRGEFLKIATKLNIHPTLVSHIFRGNKDLTLEQATLLSDYLHLNNLETDYFLLMVQIARAGSYQLKNILQRQINQIRSEALELVNQIPKKRHLSEEEKAIFYSSWPFTAISVLTSIEKYQTAEEIHKYFDQLPPKVINTVLDFLVSKGLCVFDGKKYGIGQTITHLEANSPFIGRHHTNWRLKTIERHNHPHKLSEHEISYTAPLTISEKDAKKIREEIVNLIKKVVDTVKDTDPEKLLCLNIDWMEIASPHDSNS